ncbi:hypothetical protein EVAR_75948_1 [Eumeta japonica]|uniref:Uncharacterized protein n=1 Tax=Eumeta variegata TaxID=151549 RepID=A0A4C1UY70_EUMVA|nr:hypothetical protein EVAR_75948_1 [Eumeta japonica]
MKYMGVDRWRSKTWRRRRRHARRPRLIAPGRCRQATEENSASAPSSSSPVTRDIYMRMDLNTGSGRVGVRRGLPSTFKSRYRSDVRRIVRNGHWKSKLHARIWISGRAHKNNKTLEELSLSFKDLISSTQQLVCLCLFAVPQRTCIANRYAATAPLIVITPPFAFGLSTTPTKARAPTRGRHHPRWEPLL